MRDTLNELEVRFKLNENLAGRIARAEELVRKSKDSYIRHIGWKMIAQMEAEYREGCRIERELAQTMVNRYAPKEQPSAV